MQMFFSNIMFELLNAGCLIKYQPKRNFLTSAKSENHINITKIYKKELKDYMKNNGYIVFNVC